MKNKSLFIAGIPVLLFTLFFGLAASLAQDKAPEVKKPEVSKPEVYQDKNKFFTFSPPAGWSKVEIPTDTSSQINFKSPDGKSGLGIIAQLDEGDANGLFSQKKDYIKEFKHRFPKGKFSVSWDTLGVRKVIKLNFEIPQLIKQEQYFFFDQGVRFDLVYGVANAAEFEKCHKIALDSFGTIERQSPPKKKK